MSEGNNKFDIDEKVMFVRSDTKHEGVIYEVFASLQSNGFAYEVRCEPRYITRYLLWEWEISKINGA